MSDPDYKYLASRTVTPEGAREIVREEIASLCGLVLRRLQDELDDPERRAKHVVDNFLLRQIFGEALRDCGGSYEPGLDEDAV